MRQTYPTDLTDSQWELIKPIIEEKTHKKGRPAIHNKREIVNAICYLLQSGCSWRLLPHDFPNWRTVYNHFRDWDNLGTWKQVNSALVKAYRKQKRKITEGIVERQAIENQGVTMNILKPAKEKKPLLPINKDFCSRQKLLKLIVAINKML